jgi:hypothetical protein
MTMTAASSRLVGKSLDDLDFVILENAARRKDHCVETVPASVQTDKDTLASRLGQLLKRKLVEEGPAKLEDVIWRTDETQDHKTLRITDAGITVLSKMKAAATSPARRPKKQPPKKPSATSRSKNDIICSLLKRPTGATVPALSKAAGWQLHSIRGFLSRLKKDKRAGLNIITAKDGVRRYCITGGG